MFYFVSNVLANGYCTLYAAVLESCSIVEKTQTIANYLAVAQLMLPPLAAVRGPLFSPLSFPLSLTPSFPLSCCISPSLCLSFCLFLCSSLPFTSVLSACLSEISVDPMAVSQWIRLVILKVFCSYFLPLFRSSTLSLLLSPFLSRSLCFLFLLAWIITKCKQIVANDVADTAQFSWGKAGKLKVFHIILRFFLTASSLSACHSSFSPLLHSPLATLHSQSPSANSPNSAHISIVHCPSRLHAVCGWSLISLHFRCCHASR